MGQASKKGVNFSFFLKPASPIEPSRGINQTSNAVKPEASATGTYSFSCSERRLLHPRASEVKGTSDYTEEKTADPICLVETTASSFLPDVLQVATSPPRSVKDKSDVTFNDADIPDSITRALFDALQEKWTGNQLPVTMIALALLNYSRRWRQKGTIRLDHPRYQNSTVNNTLEGISNKTSTAVPAQISNMRSDLTPTAGSRNKRTSRPSTWQLEWYGNHRTVAQLSTS